ncbi:MAG: hypothetical protein ACE5GD_09035 [Candidatus Geothermarchaeales archaeon]
MPRAIDAMKRREEELLKAVKHLSERTDGFTKPMLIMVGGYALRAFIPFSRFTRDCDFIVRKRDGWNLDDLKVILPEGYSVEAEERHESCGYMRWIKFVRYDRVRVKVSLDFIDKREKGRGDDSDRRGDG